MARRKPKSSEGEADWDQYKSDDEYLRSIRKHLLDAGVGAEIDVAAEAIERDWETAISVLYPDPHEGKFREIDVVLGRTGFPPRVPATVVHLQIVAEVKSARATWVVTPTGDPLLPGTRLTGRLPTLRTRVLPSGQLQEPYTYIRRGDLAPTEDWNLDSTLLDKAGFIGSGIREVFRGQTEASYRAIVASASATLALSEESMWNRIAPKGVPRRVLCFHPVVVHGGRLFRLGLESSDLQLEEVPWAPVHHALSTPSGITAVVVDVVTRAAWGRYLDLMEVHFSALVKAAETRAQAVVDTKP